MGQKFAAHDDMGAIVAFYDSDISPPPDGVDTIEITDDEWQAAIASQAHTVKDGALVEPTPPTKAEQLATLKASLVGAIDAAAETAYAVRGSGSAGRLAEHDQAHADALAFQEAGYKGDVPDSVQAEADASGSTAKHAAETIISTADAWAQSLVAIRLARLPGKARVMAAKTAAAAQTAADDAVAALQALCAPVE